MKIISYKYFRNGRYKIKFEKEEHIIYEDVILKNNILTKEEISEKDLELYLKDNEYYEAYYKAINYINRKLRSKLEIRKYLNKEYSSKIIDEVINKLEKDGYLDENIYTSAYINDQINLKNIGPLKIKNDLSKLGISDSIINNNIDVFTKKMQIEKINKLIEKEIKLNKNKSSIMLKNKILRSLIEKGFYKEDIEDAINTYEIDDKEIYQKEYDKIYKKLSQKYSGKDLDYKVKEKMYQKGFKI